MRVETRLKRKIMNSKYLNENEYAPYFKSYVKNLGDVDLFETLTSSIVDTLALLKDIPEEKLMYRYVEGKWTIKELIQHIIDAERILSYRALRFSRNDATDLQGFDEDWYVDHSNGNERNFKDMLQEFTHLRNATISLFTSFTDEMLTKSGSVNRSDMSVRALGFIISGHHLHHIKIIKEKYL